MKNGKNTSKISALSEQVKSHKKAAIAGAVIVVVLLALVLSRCSGGKGAGGQGGMGQGGGQGGGMGGAEEMSNVSTVNAEQPSIGTIERTSSTSGTVEPSDVVYVYAKAGGDVTSVEVKAGDVVEAGQLLLTIDTDQVESARNSMDSAAVNLSEAQSTLSRMQLLYQGGDISDQEWEQYQNNVKTAKLQYESAKINYDRQVEYSSVTAPIAGKIESCDIEVFDQVSQNTQLCVISGEGEKQVSFYVSERVVTNLSVGDTIQIRKNDVDYEGTISDINTMVDESTGLFKVKASLPEVNNIATGSTVKVTVVSQRSENVMTVPVDAIYYDGGVGNVYIYQDGTVHKQEVEVGLYDSELAEILSGLTGEEMVISTWSSQLYEGSTVKLRSETADSADGQSDSAAGAGHGAGESENGDERQDGGNGGEQRGGMQDGESGRTDQQ